MLRHRKCPHCDSSDLVRSHRRAFERVLIFLRPYRCNDCHRRFYTFALMHLPSRVL